MGYRYEKTGLSDESFATARDLIRHFNRAGLKVGDVDFAENEIKIEVSDNLSGKSAKIGLESDEVFLDPASGGGRYGFAVQSHTDYSDGSHDSALVYQADAYKALETPLDNTDNVARKIVRKLTGLDR